MTQPVTQESYRHTYTEIDYTYFIIIHIKYVYLVVRSLHSHFQADNYDICLNREMTENDEKDTIIWS